MSTRGAIARRTESGFSGVYHHWDSYPSGLGSTLFDLYRGHFDRDVENMLKTLIDDHPAGWSTINNCDWGITPGFGAVGGPQCYCHGQRSEEGNEVTEENASAVGVEYAYVFDGKKMFIFSSYCPDGAKMVGWFGHGHPDANWAIIGEVDLDGEKPDWGNIPEEG